MTPTPEQIAAAERVKSNVWTTYLGDPPRDWARIFDKLMADARLLADFVLGAESRDGELPANETWIATAIDWDGELAFSKRLLMKTIRTLYNPTRRQFWLLCEVFSIEQSAPAKETTK